MSIRLPGLLLTICFALLALSPAHAQRGDKMDELVKRSEGFLAAHPDLKHRQRGLEAWRAGKLEEAFGHFKRGARFADKPSQGMVAEMLWRGEGVAQNRAEAYAWMDLAAERKYRPMLIQREIYWEALTAQEREAAIAFGKGLYEQYGDAVAKRRTEMAMRREKKKTAGSRTGFVAGVTITIPTPGGAQTIDGSSYYHPDYWEPERYWAWQEKGWKDPPRGMVDVGPLTSAEPAATPPPAAEKK